MPNILPDAEPISDLRMVNRPDLWPLGWVLPLTRRAPGSGPTDLPQCGCLIDGVGRPTTVFVTDMYSLAAAVVGGAELDSIPHIEYPHVPALLAAGWRVD